MIEPARNILVVRGGALGDFILTLPVLEALREKFPGCRIEILGYPQIASLAVAARVADSVFPIESPTLTGFFVENGVLLERGINFFAGFDLIISYVFDPGQIFQRNVQRCTPGRFIAGSHRPNETDETHATEVLLRPLLDLGIASAGARPRLLNFTASQSATNQIAIHPGSGSEKKNWPEQKWAVLLTQLALEGPWNFLLIGGEAEGERCLRLAKLLPPERVTLAQGNPLVELAEAMSSCRGFIGHDSGISHLAAALDLPCVILWGPSNETVWRPLARRIKIIRGQAGINALPVDTVLQQVTEYFGA